MTLNELQGTANPAPAQELVSVVPAGGFGQILSADDVKEKIIVTDGAGEEAMPTNNPMVAEAMNTLDVGLTGFNLELLQLKQRGEEARENGEDIDALAQDYDPSSPAAVAARQDEFIPGANNTVATSEQATPVVDSSSNSPVSTSKEDEFDEDDYGAGEDEFVPGQTPAPATEPVVEPTAVEPENAEDPIEDTPINTNFELDENDFDDLDDEESEDVADTDEETEEQFEERKNKYISQVKALLNVIPDNDIVDLTKMQISTKSMSAGKAAGYTKMPTTTASHPLITSGKLVSMTALDAPEIANFNPDVIDQLKELSNRQYRGRARQTAFTMSSLTYYMSLLEIIYNHIVSPKPATFKAWTETIYWADIDDLIFAAYKATYGQVGNILSYECHGEKCNETWPELKNVEEMISFESSDSKWKERYEKILKSNLDASLPPERKLVQVSRDYAFNMGPPTLAKIAETAALDMDFANKYMDLISMTQYVYDVFYIDHASNTLVPVKFKEYPDDIRKTVKSRLKHLGDILKSSLSNDQRQVLVAKTDDFDRPFDAIRYIYPEAVCPKCGKKIERLYADPSTMLFTRYQLVALTNL